MTRSISTTERRTRVWPWLPAASGVSWLGSMKTDVLRESIERWEADGGKLTSDRSVHEPAFVVQTSWGDPRD
jgi:hypothetical protein